MADPPSSLVHKPQVWAWHLALCSVHGSNPMRLLISAVRLQSPTAGLQGSQPFRSCHVVKHALDLTAMSLPGAHSEVDAFKPSGPVLVRSPDDTLQVGVPRTQKGTEKVVAVQDTVGPEEHARRVPRERKLVRQNAFRYRTGPVRGATATADD